MTSLELLTKFLEDNKLSLYDIEIYLNTLNKEIISKSYLKILQDLQIKE